MCMIPEGIFCVNNDYIETWNGKIEKMEYNDILDGNGWYFVEREGIDFLDYHGPFSTIEEALAARDTLKN